MSKGDGIVGEFKALKAGTNADILAMQVGDFYEFFGEDAELVGDVLDLQLSEKASGGETYAMAGVPVAELTPYLKQLIERGYRVAVAPQRETEDGHERFVDRVVTPGTFLESRSEPSAYIAGLAKDDTGDVGVAMADVTTGEFLASSLGPVSPDDILGELFRFDPLEVFLGPQLNSDSSLVQAIEANLDGDIVDIDQEAFAPGRAKHATKEQFGSETVTAVGLSDETATLQAIGAVLYYVDETGVGVLDSMERLQRYRPDNHVSLDGTTQRNLELLETMHGEKDQSLLSVIDHTVSAAGHRRLREWLTRPSRSLQQIQHRQDEIAALVERPLARERLQDQLSSAADVERLASRAAAGTIDARSMRKLGETLAMVPSIEETIRNEPGLVTSPLLDSFEALDREAIDALARTITDSIVEDPPATIHSGGLFKRSVDEELAALIDRHESALEWIETLGERERERHGITHLQVDRNKTDGYYIQVGNSETDAVPDSYRQIKSLKSNVRFTTPELEEKEREIIHLEERRAEREYERFRELRTEVGARADICRSVGQCLGRLDATIGLAVHAVANDWVNPTVTESDVIEVTAGRHPVVEQTTEFVPNDVRLDRKRQILLVTGPNMSGKSTYLRQTALITLLAQAGSFVPAEAAEVGLVDGIFTRVGALDELAQGRSTFMVEMQELSNILHTATEDSLVLLDEVGRGTATYDGMSIAWAATEFLHNQIRAKTLFATHYHELTALAEHLPRIENVHVEADETGESVTFLHSVAEGPTNRSYGIHVADIAGVPQPVVDRSRTVLSRLRDEKAIEARGSTDSDGSTQVVFDVDTGELQTASADGGTFEKALPDDAASDEGPSKAEREVLSTIAELDVTDQTPADLYDHLAKWQATLEESTDE